MLPLYTVLPGFFFSKKKLLRLFDYACFGMWSHISENNFIKAPMIKTVTFK